MDPDSNSSSPSLQPLRIQLPDRCTAETMRRPPMEAPPFQPATLRKCIRHRVRIQNYDELQEVLILTSVICPVEDMLNVISHEALEDEDEVNHLMEEDDSFSDFSSEDDMDMDDTDTDEDSSVDDDGEAEEVMSQENCSNGNTGDRNEVQMQCTEVPKPKQNQAFRMKAFLLNKEKPLCENTHGKFRTEQSNFFEFITFIYYAKVLEKVDNDWIDTGEEVAIKANSWQCIRDSRDRLAEDVVKEIAALQYMRQWQGANTPIGTTHMDTHVLTADVVMADESDLYIVMPYCAGGDLCQMVALREEERLSNDEARELFKQILKGLETLQQMQICHKDLSPENLIILENNSLVIDFGMCLRIPYSVDGMHLFPPKTPCGKLPHMSPELYRKKPFDGHAVDIWAAGTILLFMLTGKRLPCPPFNDRDFDRIDLGVSVSHEAMDLLRKMFRLHPQNRLSLEQIRDHPFVRYQSLCQR